MHTKTAPRTEPTETVGWYGETLDRVLDRRPATPVKVGYDPEALAKVLGR